MHHLQVVFNIILRLCPYGLLFVERYRCPETRHLHHQLFVSHFVFLFGFIQHLLMHFQFLLLLENGFRLLHQFTVKQILLLNQFLQLLFVAAHFSLFFCHHLDNLLCNFCQLFLQFGNLIGLVLQESHNIGVRRDLLQRLSRNLHDFMRIYNTLENPHLFFQSIVVISLFFQRHLLLSYLTVKLFNLFSFIFYSFLRLLIQLLNLNL